MTVSRDLVNHNKWSWLEVDGRNGKGVMKSVGFPILRPLTFKWKILGQFESVKVIKDAGSPGKACHPAAFFPISFGNFLNIKITVKCRTLTSVTSKLKILQISSCSFHFWYLFRTITIFLWLTRSRGTVMQRAYSVTDQELLTRWELEYKGGGGEGEGSGARNA